MPGTPATSPNFGAPRVANSDVADFATQLNGVTDAFDAAAAKRGAIVNSDIATGAAIDQAKLALDADPGAHASRHEPGGADEILGITDAQIAAANKDGVVGTPSLRTLGQGAQQAAPGDDSRFPPVGAIMPYAGSGDPVTGVWVAADGRLIDRGVYSVFFTKVGHAYNLGVDPGNNKVKIPDKRGKKSIGAINMGTGAGASDNSHVQAVQGASGGEVNHTITTPEIPSHSHSFGSGNFLGGVPIAQSSGGASSSYAQVTINTGSGFNAPLCNSGAWTFYQSDNATGGGGSHNNADPYEADSYIVRIA